MSNIPNILVVDACILFSFFNSNSERRKIIEKLSLLQCRMISPEFSFEELLNNKEKIKKYSEINELAFSFLLSLLSSKIETISKKIYFDFLLEANSMSPHKKNTKDDPYFALALALNSPIWSDEEAFKLQQKVMVFSSNDLAKILL